MSAPNETPAQFSERMAAIAREAFTHPVFDLNDPHGRRLDGDCPPREWGDFNPNYVWNEEPGQ